MTIAFDHLASACHYVYTPLGGGWGQGQVDIPFYVPANDWYYLWGRVWAQDTSHNSLFVWVDEAPPLIWNLPLGGWRWTRVWDSGANKWYHPFLTRGWHTLHIRTREEGSKLDVVMFVNDFNCVPESITPCVTPMPENTPTPTSTPSLPVRTISFLPLMLQRISYPTATPVPFPVIIKEAEHGMLTWPMETSFDPSASSCYYVYTPVGGGWDQGQVDIPFYAPVNSWYYVWGRVRAQDASHNSFFVWVDNEPSRVIWNIPLGGWKWVRIWDNEANNWYLPFLTRGWHTLHIRTREDGSRLDTIILTNSFDYRPNQIKSCY